MTSGLVTKTVPKLVCASAYCLQTEMRNNLLSLNNVLGQPGPLRWICTLSHMPVSAASSIKDINPSPALWSLRHVQFVHCVAMQAEK